MKIEIDLSDETPELTPNAKQAQERFDERAKLRKYGDTPKEEIDSKEEEELAQQKQKREQDNPPPPEDLGKFKPGKSETLEEQLRPTDREINRNL